MSKRFENISKNGKILPFGKDLGWTSIYFIGIGGIGMSALARYFLANGKLVAGYDKTVTKITKDLEGLGASIHYEDVVKNIPKPFLDAQNTIVVYTAAMPKVHLELNYFLNNDFKVLKRAAVLGKITKNSFCLAVAGTHGKTTTSAILGHIMNTVKATSFLGGISENYHSNLILGEDTITVVEADEFDRSFLQLSPNIACVTSTDADHLDIYGAHEVMEASFVEFAEKVSDTLIVAKGIPLKGLTYAIDEVADYKAHHLKIKNGTYIFDVATPTKTIKNIELNLPGRHNVMNALAALAMADVYGIDLEVIKNELQTFKGIHRRFSYQIKKENCILIDDYAHHPTEISAVENTLREMYPNEKVLAVFQPHLFSRTKDFMGNFASALSKFDEVLLLDIYPARELPLEGITSNRLLDEMTVENKKLVSKSTLIENIKKSSTKIIVMMGAGDIGLLVTSVKNELNSL